LDKRGGTNAGAHGITPASALVLSTDRDFTIRPSGGTEVTLDLAGSSLTLPLVGGAGAIG
jgi:hypothetical protein